jgi:hypothetical protein
MMAKTLQVPWEVLRPGATVVDDHDHEHEREHKVVAVEHHGSTVSVLYWDGIRELHSSRSYARVRLSDAADHR